MGKSILLGVSETARKGKAAWIEVDGVARKWKAAWIGVDGIAKQFFISALPIVTVNAISAYERGGNGSVTGDFRALKKGTGYAAVGFPADAAFADCQKVTLHFYVVSNSSTFDTIALRDGTTKDGAYSASTSIGTPIADFTPTGTGWQSVDVTAALDADNGVTRAIAATNGVKIFLRSAGNTTIGGIGGEYCPYLTIE